MRLVTSARMIMLAALLAPPFQSGVLPAHAEEAPAPAAAPAQQPGDVEARLAELGRRIDEQRGEMRAELDEIRTLLAGRAAELNQRVEGDLRRGRRELEGHRRRARRKAEDFGRELSGQVGDLMGEVIAHMEETRPERERRMREVEAGARELSAQVCEEARRAASLGTALGEDIGKGLDQARRDSRAGMNELRGRIEARVNERGGELGRFLDTVRRDLESATRPPAPPSDEGAPAACPQPFSLNPVLSDVMFRFLDTPQGREMASRMLERMRQHGAQIATKLDELKMENGDFKATLEQFKGEVERMRERIEADEARLRGQTLEALK